MLMGGGEDRTANVSQSDKSGYAPGHKVNNNRWYIRYINTRGLKTVLRREYKSLIAVVMTLMYFPAF